MSVAVPEGIVVSLTQNKKSVVEDSLFQNTRKKANEWLSNATVPTGKEMDSVYFNTDRFELLVDTRGYKPEDLKCTVGPTAVEVVAERLEANSPTQRCIATKRCYQLPQNVIPNQAICCLSSEGILLVTVPWQR